MEFAEQLFGAEPNWAAVITTTVCGTGALLFLFKWVRQSEARARIQTARDRRAASLQRAEQAVRRYRQSHASTDASVILALPLRELAERLKDSSLDPEDVFYSYLDKALEVNKRLNCCTEILLESFEQLKTLGSNKDGLLYGVPVSIKENIGYKDHDSSCGLNWKLDQPASEDSVIVEVLKRQGAIPFVKTNIPQALLNYDCSNPIYGQTLNPHNLNKTCGGSSGGEGALIGGGGSVLGIGTDIAGSIRIPSSFCGICGIKPTAARLSVRGVAGGCPGQKSVQSTAGPMARDVDSLALCMQALLSDHMFSLDPTVPPVPFNLQMYQSSKPLRIGYYENDGCQQASPSMARGFREVKTLLEKAGHTLVPCAPLNPRQTLSELCVRGILADGAATLLNNLKGGPVDPCLSSQILTYQIPNPGKKLLSLLLKPLFPRIAEVLHATTGVRSVQELWAQHCDVENYRQDTIAEWRRSNIDVLLCPVLGPAYNFFYCGRLTCAVSSTAIYNLLNFPAGVVPVSMVTAEDEEALKHYKGNFGDPWDKLFTEAVSGAEGLPVAVQCVALPWQDELCLCLMREVEQLVKQSRR